MTSVIQQTPDDGTQPQEDTLIQDEPKDNSQSMEAALRLPGIPELLTHLKLIDAIICLRNAIKIQAEAYGIEADKAWKEFCAAAAVKFLDWTENVDVSKQTIPVPPLDILMIWHSYMLNTQDYVQFQDKARRGELAGKSFDWEELKRKLDTDYDGMSEVLGSWDPSDKAHATEPVNRCSPYGDFDMVAAVQRQLRFAEKVHRAEWRRPENIYSFLVRATIRYMEFFTLIAENPGVGLAPTLAIDLVWHTHQLSPRRYRTYSRHMTNGRFVHHDDNLDESTLDGASHNAEELYFAKYGVPYKRSMCFAKDMCFAPREGQEEPGADTVRRPDDSSCSTACSSACSTACRSGCGNYCRGGLCRDQCRAACGYVCGACDTKLE